MESKYELTVGARLGPGKEDDHEVLVLSRVVRWTDRGLEYEADPRQVEKLLREIELEGANGAVTPGVKVLSHQVESENDLPEKEFTRFRALARITSPPIASMSCMQPRRSAGLCRAPLMLPWGR